MITARRAMINAAMAKPRGAFNLPAQVGQLDTLKSHMTFFATLNAEYYSLTTALIIIMWPSFHTWPQRDFISSSIQEGFE